jgi:hypothetical protein
MSRICLVAVALAVAAVGVTVRPGAAPPPDDPNDPAALRGEWRAVEGWWGRDRIPDEEVDLWRWDFGPGDPGAPRFAWRNPPAVAWPGPPHPPFGTGFATRRSRSAEGLWEIDLYNSPFWMGGGTEGAYALGRRGGSEALRVRLAIDARHPRPRTVEGYEPGYLTVALVRSR